MYVTKRGFQISDDRFLMHNSQITPSEGITYSRAEITNALTGKTGFEPYVSILSI
jgi:hypothetical protein